MVAVQPDNIIISGIWSVLESDNDFITNVKPGNRLKQMLERGDNVRYKADSKPQKQDGDFGELDIDVGPMSMTVTQKTFCPNVRTEEHRQVFIFKITTRDTGVYSAFQLKGIVLNALRNSTRSLGISSPLLSIVDWEITSGGSNAPNDQAADSTKTGGQVRRQLTMNISIRYRLRR